MTRQCYWCARTVDNTVFFCSEKCRYEYNTAKGTDQEMYDFDNYIRKEKDSAAFGVVAGVILLGIIDFWLYFGIRIVVMPHLTGYIDWTSPLMDIIPALAVVVIDLLIIGLVLKKRRG